MIEQGLAQQRMWARGDASVEVGCDTGILGEDVEAAARQWVASMDECVFFFCPPFILFSFLTELRLARGLLVSLGQLGLFYVCCAL
jgi:hypothetical protein